MIDEGTLFVVFVGRQNARSETLYKEAVELLRSALFDNIPLPLAKGTLKGYCRLLGLEDVMAATASQQRSVPMNYDSNGDGGGDAVMAITDAAHDNNDDDGTPEIDYERVLSMEALNVRGAHIEIIQEDGREKEVNYSFFGFWLVVVVYFCSHLFDII